MVCLWCVYLGEVSAPLMVIVGLCTCIAALVIAVNMLVAVGLAHMGDLASPSRSGGWTAELQTFYLFVAVTLIFLGSARIVVRRD